MKGDLIILIPIVFPIIAAIVLALLKPLSKREHVSIYMVFAVVINALVTIGVLLNKGMNLTIFKLTAKIPVYFKIDEISILFASLVSIMWVLVGIFTIEYFKHENNYKRYIAFFLLALGILIGLCFAGNLVTMYMFYEAMTLSTMPFVVHANTKESTSAAFKYMFYSIAGAMTSLAGIMFIYVYGNTLEFTPKGVLNMTLVGDHKNLLLIVLMAMLIGFGAKAGMFPLHSWLHDAHPVAPAPASALLSGVIVKCGVLAIIRTLFYTFGVDFVKGTWVQYTWITLILITIFMGSMLAYREPILKKRLAYSTISQVSYILLGLAFLNTPGFTGGIMHVIYHAVVKIILFLTAGAIIYKTGNTRVEDLRGIGKKMPITIVCYTIASIALIGIPPTNAFQSKWMLVVGSYTSGIKFVDIFAVVILMISALLTAGYLLPITINGFWPGKKVTETREDSDEQVPEEFEKCEPNWFMLAPLIILAAFVIIMGLFPKPLASFINQLASNLL